MQSIFIDFKPPSPHIAHDICTGDGEERGKKGNKNTPAVWRAFGSSILFWLTASACLLLWMLARNPLILLWDRVPTPVFLDNPQSLTDPCFALQINPPPQHILILCTNCTASLFQLCSYDFRSPKIEYLQISCIIKKQTNTETNTLIFLLWLLLPSPEYFFSTSSWVLWPSPWQTTSHCCPINGWNLSEKASSQNKQSSQRLVLELTAVTKSTSVYSLGQPSPCLKGEPLEGLALRYPPAPLSL